MGVRICVRFGTRNLSGIQGCIVGKLIRGTVRIIAVVVVASSSWTRCSNRTWNNTCVILIDRVSIGIQMIASEKTVKRCKGISCEEVVFKVFRAIWVVANIIIE